MPAGPTPFRVAVSDDVLNDLRTRLKRTLFTVPSDSTYWAAGTDPGYLRELVAYWADEFDWRAAEAALNAFPQYVAEVAGRRVHFVHLRGRRPEGAPAPLPLVLSHGWPSSFVEMLRVAERLADPAAHGGDPADAFDVVVPSLPGFLHSELPREPFTRRGVADIWHELMTETLGYERFGAFGGDIGGGVTLARRPPPARRGGGAHHVGGGHRRVRRASRDPRGAGVPRRAGRVRRGRRGRPGLQRDHVHPARHDRRRPDGFPRRARRLDRRQVPRLERLRRRLGSPPVPPITVPGAITLSGRSSDR
ncbi:epoxide hydrolase N-terminal domain-containing protein [Streptomyces sp. NBC_01381]|uniref:epoxide hydrolase family protein n=1 Tax=Streptomyces sp. NBC_01381 TaxID=2903845 RepID=UPI00225217F2|nr:epoxide hydrolase N-terminal domain-containing protein [Streptomyces sp. NBC_01381]MCX4670606.1 epoxide hydrolase N-terminal domain-containing protein [Streptomyces sp. NBC_01381]